MGIEEFPTELLSLRLRVHVDEGEYGGHPPVPPGTVVNTLGDPNRPNFLVIELDSPIEVERPAAPGLVPIRHLAVSPIGWDLEMLVVRPPIQPSPLLVQIWHVFDPRLATSKEWTPEGMVYVARGYLSRRFAQRTQA